jgi:putative flippase GtrA/2-polyprenyl-3-methyl-5-hydroxy-6-metoxy-1,4-benzoquinol methylase
LVKRKIGNFGLTEELVRYGLVAISAFIVDLGLFYILAQKANLNYALAAVVAYTAGTIWNYFWSTRWAFAYRRLAGQLREPLTFWLIALFGLVATVGLLNVLKNLGVGLVPAKIIAEGMIAVIGFSSKKILLFTSWEDVGEVLKWYKAAPLSVRIHVLIRRWTLPLGQLLKYLPRGASSVMEIGTGYGLVLLVMAKRKHHDTQVVMTGTDIDEQKLEHARLAAEGQKVKIEFTARPSSSGQKWDTVAIIDVFYLLPPSEQQAVINQALSSLTDNGTLLIKEMDFKPAWKFWLLRTQESISVNILRITAREGGGKFYFLDLPKLSHELQERGYKTELHRLDKGLLHPHSLLLVKKSDIVNE